MGIQAAYQHHQPFPTADPDVLDAYAGAFNGIVVNANWFQLEPSPGVEKWAALDRSLAAVQAWNARHPSAALGVKLRIFAGYSAPGWVLRRSGPPVTLQTKGGQKTIGRWWTTPFRRAWHSFEHALAARYDKNALIRQVSVSSCSSSTGEPFVVSGALASRRALAAAGWSPHAQERCLEGALSDYSGWARTQITFAFNPLPTASGSDSSFMQEVMEQCATSKATGGPDCVLGNNDLWAGAPRGRSGPAYSEIAALTSHRRPRPSVYFQTAGPSVSCPDVSTAIRYHAASVELWPANYRYQGFTAIPAKTLKKWNDALSSHTKLNCPLAR